MKKKRTLSEKKLLRGLVNFKLNLKTLINVVVRCLVRMSNVTFKSPKLTFIDLKPDPVDILGIAKIVRSPSDSSKGPWFYVDARQSPPYIVVSL